MNFYAIGNQEQKIAALRKAVEDARQKARVITGAPGVEIVGVKSASGNWYGEIPPPVLYEKLADASAERATPINPGPVNIRASAEILYYIK